MQAAKMLYVSQPAVSKLVAHTETTLGLRLFERAKGRLIPTAEAHALYREVEQVYQSALRVDELARALALTDLQQEPMIVRACQQADVELTSVVDVTRADQALALVVGGLGLAIVDEFAASDVDCIVRPLVEDLEMASTFVCLKFSPPSLSATMLMQTVCLRAEQLGRRTG